ncbi:MAG: hypothetical protein V4604_13725 [Bacteroidota bacterium]
MGKIDKNKAGETALYTVDVLQKMVLGFMPGGHLIEGFLNFRSGLKQNRLISFFDSFKKVLDENVGRELKAEDFNNGDFIDVMDSIASKIQTTKSEYKLERFRNILLKQIIEASLETELILKFIQAVDELSTIQLLMLVAIDSGSRPTTLREVHVRLEEVGVNFLNASEESSEGEMSINSSDFIFYIRELINKGFVDENEVDRVFQTNSSPPSEWLQVYKNLSEQRVNYSNTEIVYTVSKTAHKLLYYIENYEG